MRHALPRMVLTGCWLVLVVSGCSSSRSEAVWPWQEQEKTTWFGKKTSAPVEPTGKATASKSKWDWPWHADHKEPKKPTTVASTDRKWTWPWETPRVKQEEFITPPQGDASYNEPPSSNKYASTYNKKKQSATASAGPMGSPGSMSSRPMPGGNMSGNPSGNGI